MLHPGPLSNILTLGPIGQGEMMGEKEVADHRLGSGEGGDSVGHQPPGPFRAF